MQAAGAAAVAAAAVAAILLTDARAAPPPRRAPIVSHAPVFRPPTRVVTPRFNRPVTQFHANRPPSRFIPPPGSGHTHTVHPNLLHRNPNLPLQGGQQAHPTLPTFTPRPGLGAQALKPGPGKPVGPRPGATPLKPAFPVITVHNTFWPILKGPKFIWFGGHRRFFVPVGLLGIALIGDSYWYPDGYVSIAGPFCNGFTPGGCRLEWRLVDFEDGGSAAQCVQYCPQAGPPPAQAATLPPPPPLVQNGNCQLTIYAEPEFGGLSAPTSENQPLLSETGWKDEISSIQVQAGTWDFFTAENFGGESLRMGAGSYPMLAPEWNKRIGSFMCVEPGAPGA